MRIVIKQLAGRRGIELHRKVDDLIDLVHGLRRDLARLNFINDRIGRIIMADLSELQSSVEANGEVTASAVALIEGLADRLDDIDTTDPAAVAALAAELRDQSSALAAAVAANTPADTGGAPTPEPGNPRPDRG